MKVAPDQRLILDVSAAISRVMLNLSSHAMAVAHQGDEQTRRMSSFQMSAVMHAEMLEREAMNIRNAITRHMEATK